MFRKRNLIALVMAAMLSFGTLGVALADDSSSYVPAPENSPVQTQVTGIWA